MTGLSSSSPSRLPLPPPHSFSLKFFPDSLLTRVCSLPSQGQDPVLCKTQRKNCIVGNSEAVPGEPTVATVLKARMVPDGCPGNTLGSEAWCWLQSQGSQGHTRPILLRGCHASGFVGLCKPGWQRAGGERPSRKFSWPSFLTLGEWCWGGNRFK